MKLRPIILIFITLLIGFFIGFLTSAQLRHKRMKPVRIYSSEERFRHDAFKFIQPTDEQVELINPVIRKYAKFNRDLQRDYRRNFEELMQKYFAEIKPFLSQEQLDQINEMEKSRSDAMKRFRSDSANSRQNRGDSAMRYNRGDSAMQNDRRSGQGRPSN